MDEILHFTLFELQEKRIAVHKRLGLITVLVLEHDQPRVIAVASCTGTQMALLLPLLEYYPAWVSYEMLYVRYMYGEVTEERLAYTRAQFEEARAEGVWDAHIRVLRNSMSRLRLTLHTVGLEISAIVELGYLLRGKDGSSKEKRGNAGW